MKQHLIAILFLQLLLIQLLPVEQIGKALSNLSWTEELPNAEIHEFGTAKSSLMYPDQPGMYFSARLIAHSTQTWSSASFSVSLPANDSGDILVPPPNQG